jgi:epoxyqueuosine reductase QueG
MPIPTADKIVALLVALSPAAVEALPPGERRRLAEYCRRAAEMAARADAPRQGVLAALREGRLG